MADRSCLAVDSEAPAPAGLALPPPILVAVVLFHRWLLPTRRLTLLLVRPFTLSQTTIASADFSLRVATSAFRSCASLRSLWPALGRTFTSRGPCRAHKKAPRMGGAKEGYSDVKPLMIHNALWSSLRLWQARWLPSPRGTFSSPSHLCIPQILIETGWFGGHRQPYDRSLMSHSTLA